MNLLSDVYILFVWEFLFFGGGGGGEGGRKGLVVRLKLLERLWF